MEETIDLAALLKTLKKHLIFIITFGLVIGIGAFLVSNFMITKKYQSSALLYVENKQTTS